MNTLLEYLYRDAENNKKSGRVILIGRLPMEAFVPCLHDGEYFIPGQVGLPDLQSLFMDFPTDTDHVWHEVLGLMDTEALPTRWLQVEGQPAGQPLKVDDLLASFQRAHQEGWNVEAAIRRLGLPVDFV